MNCRILHELPGRLRVHVNQCRMTIDEADLLEAYLKGVSGVLEAKVYERTADAVIRFRAKSEVRDGVVEALAAFDYDRVQIALPEHSGRALQHEYVDRMAGKLLRRGCSKLFLPASVRAVITVIKSVPYLLRGLRSLARGKLAVEVLDAASVAVSMLRGDFDTAGQVMFLLGIGDSPALSEADVGIAINSGAAIAREIADITISEDDLHALVTLRRLSTALMDRIHGNYRRIVGFNSALILLGMLGLLPPATTALLHNGSTIAISLKSMTELLPD